MDLKPILVTGATGFVGTHLRIGLGCLGTEVRLGTRSIPAIHPNHPHETWVHCDLDRPFSLPPALEGCRAAVYLVHGLADGQGYPQRELSQAKGFARAAVNAGLERIVYLGGVTPEGRISRHLRSRRDTGECLRQGGVKTWELRASMIVGHGSASFAILRDVLSQLPWIVLPSWLDKPTSPIAIDDVVLALVLALLLPQQDSVVMDLRGPELASPRELISRVGHLTGTRSLDCPLRWPTTNMVARLVPYLTRADSHLVRELLMGLEGSLHPRQRCFFREVARRPSRSLEMAILDALHDKTSPISPSLATSNRIGQLVRREISGLSHRGHPS